MTTFTEKTDYTGRFITDAGAVFTCRVIKRSKSSVVAVVEGKEVRRKFYINDDGVEFFFPFGRYSMAPVINADKVAV